MGVEKSARYTSPKVTPFLEGLTPAFYIGGWSRYRVIVHIASGNIFEARSHYSSAGGDHPPIVVWSRVLQDETSMRLHLGAQRGEKIATRIIGISVRGKIFAAKGSD